MKRVKKYFSSFREEEMNFDIHMRNNSKCTLVGRGIITFQRESSNNFIFTNVLYVLGMTENLILVLVLHEKGYDVSFRR
jgi:hypothetical protein